MEEVHWPLSYAGKDQLNEAYVYIVPHMQTSEWCSGPRAYRVLYLLISRDDDTICHLSPDVGMQRLIRGTPIASLLP